METSIEKEAGRAADAAANTEPGAEGGEDWLKEILRAYDRPEKDPRAYSPLALAFLGDGVYEVIIRTLVVEEGNRSAHMLHRDAVTYVRAQMQADMIEALEQELTEEEREIYRRGRNAKATTGARSASIQDYRKATGFEALVGYLFLTHRTGRILELVRKGMELTGNRRLLGEGAVKA